MFITPVCQELLGDAEEPETLAKARDVADVFFEACEGNAKKESPLTAAMFALLGSSNCSHMYGMDASPVPQGEALTNISGEIISEAIPGNCLRIESLTAS